MTRKIKVACCGDSITYGYRIHHRLKRAYPAQLAEMLGDDYAVGNFGNSGKCINVESIINGKKRAYVYQKEFRQSLEFMPDIVVINLGINDIVDWKDYSDRFVENYLNLIDAYKALESKPKIYLWGPLAPLFPGQLYFGNPGVDEINTAIMSIAKKAHVQLIDLYAPLRDKSRLFADNLHPNYKGCSIIARTVLGALSGKK